MWKKTQTYFIAIAILLGAAMFFCRLATIIGPFGEELKVMYYEKIPYAILLLMLLTAGICAICCHKFPLLQARVCTITALLFFGLQIWIGVDFFKYKDDMVFSPTMLFPLAGAILDMMAARKALVEGMAMQAVRSLKKKNR